MYKFVVAPFDIKYLTLLSDGNSNVYIFQDLLVKSHLKSLTLKIYVKLMEYNIHNCPIRWQISTSIKEIQEHFLQLSPFSRYTHFKILDLEFVG